jgi:DNA (cytosine-5)-methyltransferase 1
MPIIDKDPTLDNAQSGQPEAPNQRLYSLMDLFAGCGGLSLGFENAGFTPVFVNELNQDAMASYLTNRHHQIGNLPFAENQSLRCNDAHELDRSRLERLKFDLLSIPEIGFHTSQMGSHKNGDGSTLDVIAGGPPCQGYSGIGHRRSYSVDKADVPSNRLYARMASIIKEMRPRIFLFENVRGLLNSTWTKGGCDLIWYDVLKEFRQIEGYEVRWKLVFAKDYGVPQNRPRVLMTGIRKDIIEKCPMLDPKADKEDAVVCGFLPAPSKHSPPDLIDLLDDLVDSSVLQHLLSGKYPSGPFQTTEYPSKPITALQKKLRNRPLFTAFNKKITLTEQDYSKHKPLVVDKFIYMQGNNGDIPEFLKTKKFAQRVLPPRWNSKVPTITATSLPDDYVHYSQPRILTVREWARLQLFPDWYQFAGKRTTGGIRRAGNPAKGIYVRDAPKYTQIGNAVPVELAECVGKHFKAILDTALAFKS